MADHWHILVISKGLGYYFFIILKQLKINIMSWEEYEVYVIQILDNLKNSLYK